MNGKNLHLKFGFVAILVAACLWSLKWTGLRQGLDLRGGYSLTFEIRPPEGEAASADLAQKMIPKLKERIDPHGLRKLEFRPLGKKNWIEIRIPAPDEEGRQARNEYLRAMENIEANNIQISELRRLENAEPEQRQEIIDELSGGDEKLEKLLSELAAAYDKMTRTGSQDDIAAWEAKREEVLNENINLDRLQDILDLYVSPREAEALKETKTGREEIETRRRLYKKKLAALKQEHASRAEEIERIAEIHSHWADIRQYLDDPADLKRLIARVGILEFRIAPYSPLTESQFTISRDQLERYRKLLHEKGPDALRKRDEPFLWFPIHETPGLPSEGFSGLITDRYAGKRYLLLYNQPGNIMLRKEGGADWELTSAKRGHDSMGRLCVDFQLDESGARRMANLTRAHQTHCMAILLDNEVYSAPRIEEDAVISSRGQITGMSPDEVDNLIRILNSGSLPARINPDPVSESTFGPAIGEENRKHGIQAAVGGLLAVAAFMMLYYLLSGSIADVALLLNIILVLGTMSMMQAVFTLPGIAGLILTIGIAVDANVLIFERLREEQEKGTSVAMAIKNAYQRAFSAIFDANVTTLMTCMILVWVGTEEVRGFGITLGLGVVFSMFTALVVTRWVFQLLLKYRIIKKPVFMLRILRVPHINWIGKRHIFWVISAALLVLGVGSLLKQGSNVLGIEFSAGTRAVINFRDDALLDGKLPNDGLVRSKLAAQAEKLGYEKLKSTAQVERRIDPESTNNFLNKYDANADGKITKLEWRQLQMNEEFFPLVDVNNDGTLTRDELRSKLPSTEYQLTTTETELKKIRGTIREAFGPALQKQTRLRFDFAKGRKVPKLGIRTSGSAATRITPALADMANAAYKKVLRDYEDGALFVIRDVTPSIKQTELMSRIEKLRLSAGFAARSAYTPEVIGLESAGKGEYSSFAVLFKSGQESQSAAAWDNFAEGQEELLTEALHREATIVEDNFDPAIAGRAAGLAIVAIILSWLAIVGYLWFRFGSVRWGLAAVICLIHDVLIAVGLVAASAWVSNTFVGEALLINSFKINLAMVAAFLTVVGYSVNDTIVVFDRIRENRGKLTAVSPSIINSSINQTLPRTILTSFTTFLVVFIMYVWGGPGIHAFNYALLVGIIFGTYSSIAIASPLLMGFKRAVAGKVLTPEK